MTVVLCGIGCDTTNAGRVAPLYPDGRFEYVPIPEKRRATTEAETYGSWPLRCRDGVAADLVTSITPDPGSGRRLTGDDLRQWPVHHDPNFDAMAYGEHRPGYVEKLGALTSGDVVGFYAGLRRPDGDRAHRYLIGYVTVARIDVIPPGATVEEATEIFQEHPENAHTKRARAGGRYYDDETVVLVQGVPPGGLFDRDPIRLSEYRVASGNDRPQYYLDQSVADRFAIVDGRTNMQFKPAYRCALTGAEFRSLVGVPGEPDTRTHRIETRR